MTVTIHYEAYLKDGTCFDSSRKRGKTFEFKLGAEQVINGLEIGITQLSKGDTAKVTIPSRLGWGAKGFPGLVPGHAQLVYEIELIDFRK